MVPSKLVSENKNHENTLKQAATHHLYSGQSHSCNRLTKCKCNITGSHKSCLYTLSDIQRQFEHKFDDAMMTMNDWDLAKYSNVNHHLRLQNETKSTSPLSMHDAPRLHSLPHLHLHPDFGQKRIAFSEITFAFRSKCTNSVTENNQQNCSLRSSKDSFI